jgi:hypothetical protein
MAREKKPAGSLTRKLLLMLVLGTGTFLCVTGMVISFVLCADHISEFFNGWNYSNGWEPFTGNYFDYIRQIPKEVYVAFGWFPEACFITLIFYPLAVLGIGIYEVAYGEFTIVLYGWLPFLTGAFGMVFFGFMLLKEDDSPHAGKYDRF